MPVLKTLLVIGTIGLGMATVAALLARHWWAFDLFSHFRLQYALGALVLLGLALLVRSMPTAAVLALIVVIHGVALKDLWLGGDGEGVPAGHRFRLAAANVLSSNRDKAQVIAFVREAEPDLLVLVEADRPAWRDALRAIGELYPHAAPEGWRDGAPVVLFSRSPVASARLVEPPAGRRPYLLAEVELPAGEVLVAGVHPSSPSPRDPEDTQARNAQLDHIAADIDDTSRPLIVTGDFNTSPFSPHFRDLVRTTGLRNAAAGGGYYATWPRWLWPARIPIDHVLIRGPLHARDFRTGHPTGSDHLPVIADLVLGDGAAPEPAR